MKTAAQVFIWIGMIGGALFIFPLIIGIFALQELEEAKTADELTGWAIATLLCCSMLAGIFMLCLKDADLVETVETTNTQTETQDGNVRPNVSIKNTKGYVEERLLKAKSLHEKGILNDQEYKNIKESLISEYLKD